MKRILFFTTSLERTGSEIALFNFLTFSGITRHFEVHITTLKKGYLIDQLHPDFRVHIYEDFYHHQKSFINKLLYKLKRPKNYNSLFLKRVFHSCNPDFIFLNGFNTSSTFLIDYLKEISFPKKKVALYSHEMSVALTSANSTFIKKVRSVVGKYYACSESSGEMLKILFTIKPRVLYPGINDAIIDVSLSQRKMLKNDLDIEEHLSIWAMSGYCDQNKDPIFFVNLFQELVKRERPVFFLWIGANETSGFTAYCQSLIVSRNLKNIRFIPNIPAEEYYPILELVDGFVLTSSVDSFPLVMLEAAYMNKAIVSHNSGGVREFLEKNGRVPVAEKTITCYADEIEKCINQTVPEYEMNEFLAAESAKNWLKVILQDFK